MTGFLKYPHLERLGSSEVEDILYGDVYAFYKIDGTNASIWWDYNKQRMRFGSRNRELDLENDNAGFMNALYQDKNLLDFFGGWPEWRLYGEWLVPHSLKTYRDDAWRRFYVFDVYDTTTETFLPYDRYKVVLDEFNLEYIPPLAVMRNPSEEQVLNLLEKTGQFLVKDGQGNGEGIVLKNYNYKNKYDRVTWAKVISNEFKERHHKEMGAPLVNGTKLIEEEIVQEFVTVSFVLKEKAKIENELGEWSSRYIPRLLGTIFHELIVEETWNILKKHKNPKINFGLLQKLTIDKTKKVIGI